MKKRGVFFYILIVLALLAIAALIFLLAPGNEPETPAVALPPVTAPETSDEEQPGDGVLQHTVEITPATVQTAIGTLRRAENYSRTLTVERYWAGGRSTETLEVWVKDGSCRISVRSDAADTVKNILLIGREKWIWYNDRDDVFHGTARAGDTDAYQTLLTYEDILSLDAAKITDAGYTAYEGTDCVFVRYTDGPFDYDHFCYIALETGLLMGQESYDGESLIYAMHSDVPELSVPDEALFQAPKTEEALR